MLMRKNVNNDVSKDSPKAKKKLCIRSLIPGGLVGDTNMAAIPLFGDTNMFIATALLLFMTHMIKGVLHVWYALRFVS